MSERVKKTRSNTAFIYGKHAVMEALSKRPDVVRSLYLDDAAKHPEVYACAEQHDLPVKALDARHMPGDIRSDATHQGVIAEIDTASLMIPYRTFIEGSSLTPETMFVVLGEVQDPHNVGAVIRAAAAFGASGVFIPPHKQASVTGTVIKVSAGMAFRVPLVTIPNVNTVLRDLKERGVWIYGLDETGERSIGAETFDRPSAFVLGNEATGIRVKTRDTCDTLLRIPMHPQCESLNAAASTAVALYAWSVQHPAALR